MQLRARYAAVAGGVLALGDRDDHAFVLAEEMADGGLTDLGLHATRLAAFEQRARILGIEASVLVGVGAVWSRTQQPLERVGEAIAVFVSTAVLAA